MMKITLILGLALCAATPPAFAAHSAERTSTPDDGLDRPLTNEGSSQAERKLLNGDGYGQPSEVPDEADENEGNHHCKGEDCERE
ncbi:MAG: hypothetical protein AB7K68_10075 [Bacteriovoracia bacterium]